MIADSVYNPGLRDIVDSCDISALSINFLRSASFSLFRMTFIVSKLFVNVLRCVLNCYSVVYLCDAERVFSVAF